MLPTDWSPWHGQQLLWVVWGAHISAVDACAGGEPAPGRARRGLPRLIILLLQLTCLPSFELVSICGNTSFPELPGLSWYQYVPCWYRTNVLNSTTPVVLVLTRARAVLSLVYIYPANALRTQTEVETAALANYTCSVWESSHTLSFTAALNNS